MYLTLQAPDIFKSAELRQSTEPIPAFKVLDRRPFPGSIHLTKWRGPTTPFRAFPWRPNKRDSSVRAEGFKDADGGPHLLKYAAIFDGPTPETCTVPVPVHHDLHTYVRKSDAVRDARVRTHGYVCPVFIRPTDLIAVGDFYGERSYVSTRVYTSKTACLRAMKGAPKTK